jgi:hypothetical protein
VEGGERGIVLVKLAVLATVFGAFPHLGSALCVHRLGRGAADFQRQPFEDGDEFVGSDVALVFREIRSRLPNLTALMVHIQRRLTVLNRC